MERREADARRRVDAAAARLMKRLDKAARELDAVPVTYREKIKTDTGEKTVEYTELCPGKKGPVDRNGLKVLTGVLQELQDILLRDPELELREREAKLLRLERELTGAPDGERLTVVLEGEAEHFAE